MPALSNLTRQKPVEKLIHIGDGDQVSIVFDRNSITPAWVKSAQADERESDPFTVPKALAAVIISWDVTDDDGNVLPTDADTLAMFSVPAQGALLDQIMSAAFPSDAEGKASSGPPSTPPPDFSEPAATSPNGQATSPSPELLASPSPT